MSDVSFLESPRWHDGRVWASDFYTNEVASANEDGSDFRVEAVLPAQPSGLGWLPDGRLVIVGMRGHRLFRREPNGQIVMHADVASREIGVLNDLAVDTKGRAYVTGFLFNTWGRMTHTPVIAVDENGEILAETEPLACPNGVTVAGNELIVAETLASRLSSFALDEAGRPGSREDWAVFGPAPEDIGDLAVAYSQMPLAPDGISSPDAEGAIWVADVKNGRAVRVQRGGEILDEVSTGDLGCFSLTLGGLEGKSLFLCAAPTFLEVSEDERRTSRDAKLFSYQVDVPLAAAS
jgi:sugar lactone lactonase YvrE